MATPYQIFTELANALDYLHNHDPQISYIHGDLKPQNVFWGDLLQIKLGDFGSTTTVRFADETSTETIRDENTQYSPKYVAPEFLSNPTAGKYKSMDVYGFAMIGYEILTRQGVFSAVANINVMITLKKEIGQTPDVECLNMMATALKNNNTDFEIFGKLEKTVKDCWKFKPDDRPSIANVKNDLFKLAQSKKVYDETIDEEIKTIIQNEKQTNKKQQPKKFTAMEQWKLWITAMAAIAIYTAMLLYCCCFWCQKFRYLDAENGSNLVEEVGSGSILEEAETKIESILVEAESGSGAISEKVDVLF